MVDQRVGGSMGGRVKVVEEDSTAVEGRGVPLLDRVVRHVLCTVT